LSTLGYLGLTSLDPWAASSDAAEAADAEAEAAAAAAAAAAVAAAAAAALAHFGCAAAVLVEEGVEEGVKARGQLGAPHARVVPHHVLLHRPPAWPHPGQAQGKAQGHTPASLLYGILGAAALPSTCTGCSLFFFSPSCRHVPPLPCCPSGQQGSTQPEPHSRPRARGRGEKGARRGLEEA